MKLPNARAVSRTLVVVALVVGLWQLSGLVWSVFSEALGQYQPAAPLFREFMDFVSRFLGLVFQILAACGLSVEIMRHMDAGSDEDRVRDCLDACEGHDTRRVRAALVACEGMSTERLLTKPRPLFEGVMYAINPNIGAPIAMAAPMTGMASSENATGPAPQADTHAVGNNTQRARVALMENHDELWSSELGREWGQHYREQHRAVHARPSGNADIALGLDIHAWLVHRSTLVLGERTVVSWALLYSQFGEGFASDEQGQHEFKVAFLRQLANLAELYAPALQYDETESGLVFHRIPLNQGEPA